MSVTFFIFTLSSIHANLNARRLLISEILNGALHDYMDIDCVILYLSRRKLPLCGWFAWFRSAQQKLRACMQSTIVHRTLHFAALRFASFLFFSCAVNALVVISVIKRLLQNVRRRRKKQWQLHLALPFPFSVFTHTTHYHFYFIFIFVFSQSHSTFSVRLHFIKTLCTSFFFFCFCFVSYCTAQLTQGVKQKCLLYPESTLYKKKLLCDFSHFVASEKRTLYYVQNTINELNML